MEPQAAYAASLALCITDRADIQPRPQSQARAHGLRPAAIQPFNGLHPRNSRRYMDLYSFTDPRGMEV